MGKIESRHQRVHQNRVIKDNRKQQLKSTFTQNLQFNNRGGWHYIRQGESDLVGAFKPYISVRKFK